MATSPHVPVKRVKLGSQGMEVAEMGLGCGTMSAWAQHSSSRPDDADMVKLIRHAVTMGVTYLDSDNVHGGNGANEVLVGRAIQGIRDKVQIATKFGLAPGIVVRGDPEYVRACCEESLQRLGVDCIDLYYQHRVDKSVPIEATVGEMKKLVEEGKVKYIGLSECPSWEIRRAHAVHPITAVQIEWSLWARDAESDLIPTCRELGIGVVAYSPLGRGFFAKTFKKEDFAENDFRTKMIPLFQGENLAKNQILLERVAMIAKEKKCTTNQLALAWVRQKGAVPIPGTTKMAHLESNVGALDLTLTEEDMKALEDAVPPHEVAGGRYAGRALELAWQNIKTPPLSSWNRSV